MGTPWDRAALGYLEEWVPRFVPYHLDLVREMALTPGQRVLVPSAGPGAEVLAVARAVGSKGFVRATDKSSEMVRICREQIRCASLGVRIDCEQADATDARGGPWDAVVCAFGLWQLPSPVDAVRAWGSALAPDARVGIVTWGPSDPTSPFDRLREALARAEPARHVPDSHVNASRDAMTAMFDRAGLVMVRHTVVSHTLVFKSNESFVRAMREACTWRRVWEEVGDGVFDRVAALFYDSAGGPDAPLSFAPAATVALATLPSAQ